MGGAGQLADRESHQQRQVSNGREMALISVDGRDFVSSLLQKDARLRPDTGAALSHPWILAASGLPSSSLATTASGGTSTVRGDIGVDTLLSLRRFARSSHLRRVALTQMAFSLTSRELESLEETFLAFDKTGKGTITLQELADVMHEHMGDVTSIEVQRIFESLDFAQEEEVHYTPFIAAMLATRVRLHEDKVRAAFEKFDSKNTGFITADSLVAMFGGLDGPAGGPLTKLEAEQWITEVDYKRNGVIDYEGFMSALMGKRLWELPALNDEEQPTVKVYQGDGDLLRARSDDALFIPGAANSKLRHDLAAILIDGPTEDSRNERKTQSFPTVMPSEGSGDIKQMLFRGVACPVDEDHFTR